MLAVITHVSRCNKWHNRQYLLTFRDEAVRLCRDEAEKSENGVFHVLLIAMDVRKLVIVLCVLTLVVVGVALYVQEGGPPVRRPPTDPAIAESVEVRHGPALRAIGIRSLGVDRQTDDVVVVFTNGGRLGRKVAGRLPGLAGKDGCGKLDVGIVVGDSISAWGNSRSPGFYARLDCVIKEVIAKAADLRESE